MSLILSACNRLTWRNGNLHRHAATSYLFSVVFGSVLLLKRRPDVVLCADLRKDALSHWTEGVKIFSPLMLFDDVETECLPLICFSSNIITCFTRVNASSTLRSNNLNTLKWTGSSRLHRHVCHRLLVSDRWDYHDWFSSPHLHMIHLWTDYLGKEKNLLWGWADFSMRYAHTFKKEDDNRVFTVITAGI